MTVPTDSPHWIGRRQLLRAAGVGVAATAASAAGLGVPGKARAAPRTRPANDDLPLVGGPEFPIGLFWPPPPFETTLARYREIADAGFSFLITGNYLFDEYIARYALGFADEVGLKVLVANDPRVFSLGHHLTVTDDRTVASSITTADATTWMTAAFDNYTAHPSFAGFNVYDEPAQERFANVGALMDISRDVRPGLLPYANLVPGQGAAYAEFVQSYIDQANPSLLSFDRYPILTEGIDQQYFHNWVIYRNASLRTGLPVWTFIQTLGYNGHRTPTADELAWQVNVSLAYGCKGIQYFTYWTPDPARGEGFTPALLTVDGHRTPRYAASKALNNRWLRPVGRELKPKLSVSVQHANEDPLPPETEPFRPDDHVTSAAGDAAILGMFRTPSDTDDGIRWLLVVNRDPGAAASVRLGLADKVTAAARFDPTTGDYIPLPATTLDVDLKPGAATLFRLTR